MCLRKFFSSIVKSIFGNEIVFVARWAIWHRFPNVKFSTSPQDSFSVHWWKNRINNSKKFLGCFRIANYFVLSGIFIVSVFFKFWRNCLEIRQQKVNLFFRKRLRCKSYFISTRRTSIKTSIISKPYSKSQRSKNNILGNFFMRLISIPGFIIFKKSFITKCIEGNSIVMFIMSFVKNFSFSQSFITSKIFEMISNPLRIFFINCRTINSQSWVLARPPMERWPSPRSNPVIISLWVLLSFVIFSLK